MKGDRLRNFTVRFLESALQRVESSAKPFYGGRLSTGEAIRRLAEERLIQIEGEESTGTGRAALLRILGEWRSGKPLSATDLIVIAAGANSAYRQCRRDFVSRDLLIASVSAFREALRASIQGKSGKGSEPDAQYYLGNLRDANADGKTRTVVEHLDHWIKKLPELPSPTQAEFASRNLLALLRDQRRAAEPGTAKALDPFLPALLQLAIRSYWNSERLPLVEIEKGPRHSRPSSANVVQSGRVSLTPSIGDHDITVAIEFLDSGAVVTANNFVEGEDLVEVTHHALAGHYVRGEVFHWSRVPGDAKRVVLSTDRTRLSLKADVLTSVGTSLDRLFSEPSVDALVQRLRFVYGRD